MQLLKFPLRGVSNLLDLRDIRRRDNLADDIDRPISFLDVGRAAVVVIARASDRLDHPMGFKQRDYSRYPLGVSQYHRGALPRLPMTS